MNDGLSANLNHLPFIKACYGYGRDQDWSKVNTYQEIYENKVAGKTFYRLGTPSAAIIQAGIDAVLGTEYAYAS